MSLLNTAFIGSKGDGKARLPFEKLLKRYEHLRDATAQTVHGEHATTPELWPFVAIASFSYAFNAYKALGLILPELYHESGAVLLRQLWEASLNLHWIERDPETRAQDFCNYTVIELRKNMQKSGEQSSLASLDAASTRFQSRFRFKDKQGKERIHSSFAGGSVQQRAEELGEPWSADYNLLYHLASMHAHGAPGAVLHPYFVHLSTSPQNKERDSTALIAFLSMKVLVADIHLLVRNGFVADSTEVDEAFKDALE
ncbi:MAG: hypothetical protein QOF24_604 [Verrucomicrobiota bacterium]|jgi:hypothetical protein